MSKKEKKPSRLARLEAYADGRHHFIAAANLMSAASSVIGVVPFYFLWKIADDTLEGRTGDLEFYGWMALLFAVISIFVYIAGLMVSHLAAFRITKNIKKKLIGHVLSLPAGSIDEEGTGRIRRVIHDSVGSTHEFLAHNQPDLMGTKVLPIAIVALLLIIDWRLGIASLIPVILGIMVSMSMMGKSAMQESMTAWQNSMAEVSNQTVEYIRGISVVKIFQQTVDSFQNLKRAIDDWADYCQGYTKMARIPMSEFFALINGCIAFIVAAAVLIVEFLEDGEVTGGLIAAVVFYFTFTSLISTLMMRIMFTSDQTYYVDDALSRFDGILAMAPMQEPSEPRVPKDSTIRFENVTFAYSEEAGPVVRDFSLELRQGSVTALVGPSGSGKSTVAGLAARFWDPQSGRVTIGGEDLRDVGSRGLRSMESHVFQNNRLIKGTLMENVRLGCPDADAGRVSEALKLAQCDDIVAKMPQGLDTLIGPGGVYLSGGEVQRIAIARAILRDAPVIILDEATAFADPENEHLIQKAIEALSKGRTLLIIAHRLTTVRNADLICVMDNGTITESGRHDELVSAGGQYRRMWDDYQKALSWRIKEAGQ